MTTPAAERLVDAATIPMELPPVYLDMVYGLVHDKLVHDEDYEMFTMFPPTTMVVDVGSNIGNSAISIYNRCPQAKIFGYEANPILRPFLETEAARNPNYQFKLVGLGDQVGTMDLYTPIVGTMPILGESSLFLDHFNDPVASARLSSYSDTGEFTLVKSSCTIERLDDQGTLFEAAQNSTHRVIKIDVEGAELNVLQGAINFIRTFHPTFLIEDGGRPEIVCLLADLGYSRYILDRESNYPMEAHGRSAVNSIFFYRDVF